MSSRHQPTNGADSEWQPRPFRVLMEDDDGGRHNVIIRAAIGPRDAMGQARDRHPYDSALRAVEVDPDEAQRWAAEDRTDDLAKRGAA